MRDYLDKLREKPEHERQRFVLKAMAVSFGVVLLIWVLTLVIRFDANTADGLRKDLQSFRPLGSVFKAN